MLEELLLSIVEVSLKSLCVEERNALSSEADKKKKCMLDKTLGSLRSIFLCGCEYNIFRGFGLLTSSKMFSFASLRSKIPRLQKFCFCMDVVSGVR